MSFQASRRVFMLKVAAGGGAVVAFAAQAQPAKVDEKDPQAVAVGYVGDTTKVSQAKYPKHAADQKCSGYPLYSGKPADAAGPCALFAGKLVNGAGWCSAWTKKAG